MRMPSDKREAILRAALELMSQRTYTGTPMPLVAQRAAVGAGTIYRYFENKEALANAVFRQCEAELLKSLQNALRVTDSAREQFRSLWRGLWEFSRKNPYAFHFIELHHHQSYLDPESRALADSVIRFVEVFIERFQREGVLRSDPPVLLIALAYGAFVGLHKAEAERRLVLDEETIASSEAALWDLLRKPEE